MRLIDADALMDNVNNTFAPFVTLLSDAPTIDAVPVVRCKDCKYFLEDGDCFCENIEQYEHEKSVSPDWFCADGERREQCD